MGPHKRQAKQDEQEETFLNQDNLVSTDHGHGTDWIPRICIHRIIFGLSLSLISGGVQGQTDFGGTPSPVYPVPSYPSPGPAPALPGMGYPSAIPGQPPSQSIPSSSPEVLGPPTILSPPVVVEPMQGTVPSVPYPPTVNPSALKVFPSRSGAPRRDAPRGQPSSNLRLETLVSVSAGLQDLLRKGGEPRDLDRLRLLESQIQLVAKRAGKCTVSVQVGPAQGCGVIITDSGYVLTAAHVAMRPNKRARLTLFDGRRVWARTLGMNRRVDAGLMKIEPNQNAGNPWPHASLGNSSKLSPGMWCIAMGHPGGYDSARGSVARVGRILTKRLGAIETDCALIGGDSGGPLFDIAGRLIAVHSRIGNDVTENLHVPVDYYGKSWDRMRSGEAYGYLPGFRPVLGVKGKTKSLKATVTIVKRGSPAEEAGLKVGDTIMQFGEVAINSFESLQKAVAETMPGERVPVLLVRDSGATERVIVEIGRAD